MKITLARRSHIPEIVEIWKEFMDFHGEIDPFFIRRDNGHLNFEKFVKESIVNDGFFILVAMDKGRVVAYSISQVADRPPVFQHRKYGIISDMAVKSEYRRRGIGEQMLTEILSWFQSQHIQRMQLRVVVKNQIGYSFWKKHGFKDYMHVLYLER